MLEIQSVLEPRDSTPHKSNMVTSRILNTYIYYSLILPFRKVHAIRPKRQQKPPATEPLKAQH